MALHLALIGATGLIGKQLWPMLEQEHRLLVLGRRASGAQHERLAEAEQWSDLLTGEQVDVAISTLGTTIGKAGSWDAMERIDRVAVTRFAAAARRAGARQFIHVSSVGADPQARMPYLRIKGRTEQELEAIGFERLDIVQPGLLLGDRTERRLAEGIGQRIAPLANLLLRGPLERYQAIEAGAVAKAIAALVGAPEEGRRIHTNREIKRLARS